jgi:hypothetical protein
MYAPHILYRVYPHCTQ